MRQVNIVKTQLKHVSTLNNIIRPRCIIISHDKERPTTDELKGLMKNNKYYRYYTFLQDW